MVGDIVLALIIVDLIGAVAGIIVITIAQMSGD